jgi:hypothetical protein
MNRNRGSCKKASPSESQPVKKKRNVLLDAESEKLIKQEEIHEFSKVLQEQFSHVDLNKIGTLPECEGKTEISLPRIDTWEYWMSVMMQYQSFRSFPHYSNDEEHQQKQLEWQKGMRFQLMQKKRAIKREKRRLLKLQKTLANGNVSKRSLAHTKKRAIMDLGNDALLSKRTKLDSLAMMLSGSSPSSKGTEELNYNREDNDDSFDMDDDDLGLDILLPSPMSFTYMNHQYFPPTFNGE